MQKTNILIVKKKKNPDKERGRIKAKPYLTERIYQFSSSEQEHIVFPH